MLKLYCSTTELISVKDTRETSKFWYRSLFLILSILGVTNISSSALASGFSLTEQSVKNLGNAAAGGAALAEDASTIFYNPAGLTRLSESSVEGAGYIIFSTIQFQNQGSVATTGEPLSGGERDNAGVNSFVPNLYGFWSVSESLKLGIGISPPFGLATEYDNDWVGRYQAIESRLKTVNINPSVALKITDTLSVGGGLNLQYADAELSNAIDFGLIGQSVLGTQSQQLDGLVEISGDDWSFGYNLGILKDEFVTARIPDSDRFWLSFGSSYQVSSSISLDVAYVHIFFEDQSINKSERLRGTLSGDFEGQADIIGLQLNWKF